MEAPRVVIDTNVLTAALLRSGGRNRDVLRACFEDRLKPLIAQALFLEYEDVLGRQALFLTSPLDAAEREEFFHSFLGLCEWVSVYYLWRPNLSDEGDNHIVELAVAGRASMIVTNNIRDFANSELRFPEIRVVSPVNLLKELA